MPAPPSRAGCPGRCGRSGPRRARRSASRRSPRRSAALISTGTMSSRPPCVSRAGTPSGSRSIGDATDVGCSPRKRSTTPSESRSSRARCRSSTPAWETTPVSGHLRRLAGRRPRRQVPAGAVADRHDATAVHRQVGEQIDRGGHVLERRRHAAAVAEPPVLDVPRRPPARGEILRQRLHQVQSVLVLPEPAVDEHRDRPLAVQHAVLRGVVAVPMKLRLQGSGAPPRAW